MPKETIKEWAGGKAAVEVRWGADHFNMVQLVVDRSEPFVFCSELDQNEQQEFTGLALTLSTKDDISRLIKALQRARRKTFK